MAKILLAEDDESMLNFLTLALERAGHTVCARRDGVEALQILHEGQTFDLLLTDIVMPGIDGIELAQKAAEIQPEIKIMFVTGFAAMSIKDIGNAKENVPQMLSKPFHLNDLVDQVERLLSASA
ncbi:MAG: response regulator [Alphaproteobacteria bacterium]